MLAFTIQKTVSALILTTIQVTLLFLIATLIFGISFSLATLPYLMLSTMLISMTFIGIGMSIAMISESENTAFMASLLLAMPLMFMSGLFFPFEIMPPLTAYIGSILPITQGIHIYMKLVMYQTSVMAVMPFFAILGVYALSSVFLAYLVMRYKGAYF